MKELTIDDEKLLQPITKPIIKYSNIEALRDFVKEFTKKYLDKGWEELIEVDQRIVDDPYIRSINTLICPIMCPQDNHNDYTIELWNRIDTNILQERFLITTGIPEKVKGNVIFPEGAYAEWNPREQYVDDFSGSISLSNIIVDDALKRDQYIGDCIDLKLKTASHEKEVNFILDSLFHYMRCEAYDEKIIELDFGKMDLMQCLD